MMNQLKIRDFVPKGNFYHVAQVPIRDRKPDNVHTHDFHEIFWVESGTGIHWINGRENSLEKGQLLLIRDTDFHTFSAASSEPLVIVNVAFPVPQWKSIHTKYFSKNTDPFARPLQERTREITSETLFELQRLHRWLDHSDRGTARIDLFLIEIMTHWFSPQLSDSRNNIPSWLQRALQKLSTPEILQGGTSAFARIACKSPDHVNRETKKHLGKTPTEIINEERLRMAASGLTQTEDLILDIAADCGLPNLAHFYKLFHSKYRMSPRRYRVHTRRIVMT